MRIGLDWHNSPEIRIGIRMRILAIDTSCDDTAVAVIEADKREYQRGITRKIRVRSNVVSSQVKLHRKYGGVYPTLAKREHQRNLLPVLMQVLKQSKLLKISNPKFLISKQIQNSKFKTLKEILAREEILYKQLKQFLGKYQKPAVDAIAVTKGPGLEPCLWVGVNFARALAFWWNLPIIPVNHIEAHILASFVGSVSEKRPDLSQFEKNIIKDGRGRVSPAVCLVVSGGHTQLILMKGVGKYKIIGETLDDAAGECLDKTARVLGLKYPGGPAIATEAAKIINPKSEFLNKFQIPNSKFQIHLPRPMLNSKDYDFSFSGLKTAVLYDYKKRPPHLRESKEYIRAMAKEIQQAIIDVLISKTIKAAKEYGAKSILLGGGVAANDELRKQLMSTVRYQLSNVNFFAPQKNFCTDNAAMIGMTGYFHYKSASCDWGKVKAKANLRL